MKTKWFRIMAAAIAILMAMTLGACKQTTGGAGTKAPSGSTLDTKGVKLVIQTSSNVEQFPEGMDENNNLIINFLREVTGYDLEWIISPREGAVEWMSAMMTSGTSPDMIRPGKAEFLSYVDQDLLTPLDESLEKYGPDIMAKVDEDTWLTATFDGKKYAITVPTQYISGNGIMYRGDWLDKLGLEVPRTLDEFVEVLRKVRDEKPGGENTIPFVAYGASGVEAGLEGFRGAFGVAASDVDENGVYQDVFLQEGMRKYVEFCRMLYAEKIIDPEYPVNKTANMTEKMAGGLGFMTCLGWSAPRDIVKALAEKDSEARIDYITEGPVGENGEWGYPYSYTPYCYLAVPIHSKDKVDYCVDFVNKLTDEEVRIMMNYGPEGEFNTYENGMYVPNERAAKEFGYNVYYIAYWTEPEDFLNRCKTKGFWDAYSAFEPGARNRNLLAYIPLLDAVEANKTDRSDLWNEYFLNIVTGKYDMSKFDEFITRYKELGAEEANAAIQTWYDETMK